KEEQKPAACLGHTYPISQFECKYTANARHGQEKTSFSLAREVFSCASFLYTEPFTDARRVRYVSIRRVAGADATRSSGRCNTLLRPMQHAPQTDITRENRVKRSGGKVGGKYRNFGNAVFQVVTFPAPPEAASWGLKNGYFPPFSTPRFLNGK
ncbi:MAG: hypothetical protein II746_07250, partial [Bacteroidaceae bacterium]|nr:hypothetical protein [Bacteroidaceae bacterium]